MVVETARVLNEWWENYVKPGTGQIVDEAGEVSAPVGYATSKTWDFLKEATPFGRTVHQAWNWDWSNLGKVGEIAGRFMYNFPGVAFLKESYTSGKTQPLTTIFIPARLNEQGEWELTEPITGRVVGFNEWSNKFFDDQTIYQPTKFLSDALASIAPFAAAAGAAYASGGMSLVAPAAKWIGGTWLATNLLRKSEKRIAEALDEGGRVDIHVHTPAVSEAEKLVDRINARTAQESGLKYQQAIEQQSYAMYRNLFTNPSNAENQYLPGIDAFAARGAGQGVGTVIAKEVLSSNEGVASGSMSHGGSAAFFAPSRKKKKKKKRRRERKSGEGTDSKLRREQRTAMVPPTQNTGMRGEYGKGLK
jgi:hypothetical protein